MYKNDAFCHSHIKTGVIPVCQNTVTVSIYYEFKVTEGDDTFRNMIWKEQPDLAILNIGTHELFRENYSKIISQGELLGKLPLLLDHMASTLEGLKGQVVWWSLPPALGGGPDDLRSYKKTLRQYDLNKLHRKHFKKLEEKGSFTILDTHFMGLGGFLRVDVTHYNYVFNRMLLHTIVNWLKSNEERAQTLLNWHSEISSFKYKSCDDKCAVTAIQIISS